MSANKSNVDIPRCGWRVKLSHKFPQKWSDQIRPRLNQIWVLIPLTIRYILYWIYMKARGRRPLMDYLELESGQQIYGVPIGGIGAGSIGRGFKGEFCRYALLPGIYKYKTIPANMFIVTISDKDGRTLYQSTLTPKVLDAPKSWRCLLNPDEAEYTGLFPQSWIVYNIPQQNVVLTCKQISPVIPHNYKDSSIPGAVFIWTIENNSDEEKYVSITFTFQNGAGDKSDKEPGCWSETFQTKDESISGIKIHHLINQMPYTYCVSARKKDNVNVTTLRNWNPLSDGAEVWDLLAKNGALNTSINDTPSPETKQNELLGCAVCARTKLSSHFNSSLEFCLVWDMPQVNFGYGGQQYYRFYTKYFGKDGNAGLDITSYCLDNYKKWETAINEWQKPVLDDEELPDWYKSALFNETYYVTDGGTVWFLPNEDEKLSPDDPRLEYGRFGYLEGHEYRMYNTYDVHFYASYALAMLWPKLQSVLQWDFNDSISQENRDKMWHLYDGSVGFRKVKNSIPHDLGDPYEDPFLKINAYPIHDVSEWRDLNLKFVLQCYRDYKLSGDLAEIMKFWPNICLLMNESLKWDTDGDGMIENGGFPDQTYDTWTMDGVSAYCGSLWLAAVYVTCAMAKLLGDQPVQDKFLDILNRGKESFEKKLWNGTYYKFDSSKSEKSDSIMADQLCGLWYLKCCDVDNKQPQVFKDSNVQSALSTIYEFNVLQFCNGSIGAVNGMKPNGSVDYFTIQSEEVWTGVVYGLASLMIHEGLVDKAFKTAEGMYETVYNKIGLGYETPEALYEKDAYRSIGYMRPLSIWSMQLAWEMRNKRKMASK